MYMVSYAFSTSTNRCNRTSAKMCTEARKHQAMEYGTNTQFDAYI